MVIRYTNYAGALVAKVSHANSAETPSENRATVVTIGQADDFIPIPLTTTFPIESSYLYCYLIRLRSSVGEIDMINITRKNLSQLRSILDRRYSALGKC
jgi:hypothetical protein